ncbi:ABC transporter substrate-binding protein [Thiorhodococcus mannitoliphagus]|uniref:ABC transporter substrate-binding protein n=1 Tax=Thiorhodococcus mannitoliphagus TaxID=329406 RepID=A0A6P1DVR3_9GAMM|nr:ABC transporter substrate-binding protein [Thiorhodococcus mannitoliphagus]NEX19774.1 ABC transporter substrate-binding protein [Thiorhodococcus mannitoliphagus]
MLAPPAVFLALAVVALAGCDGSESDDLPTLRWYVFKEQSGAFEEAARRCTALSEGRYRLELASLPTDADLQRELLVRRLAAGDKDIDLIGMDVIWTAEFAEAGWILPWPDDRARAVLDGRIAGPVASGAYDDRLWAAPFTTNTQLLWYRTDRAPTPPTTWDAMIDQAESIGEGGLIQAQGERYEGLTVFFVSLLASAGGAVLDESGQQVSLEPEPTRKALEVMRRLARSSASDPSLASSREDQCRLAFESGRSAFMLNYSYVWPSAHANAPEVAEHMGWARWPAVDPAMTSRVTIGGINLGVGANSRHPKLAFEAASCLVSEENQRLAARLGGLPPTLSALYDDAEIRAIFPFADVLRATLADAVQRPTTPVYSDLSIAISRTLHPLREIDPERDVARLRRAVERALHSEGLL